MKRLKEFIPALLAALIVVILLVGGTMYISSVQASLWNLTVNNLKEITEQGGHSFEVYLRKDLQSVHGLAQSISQSPSDDVDYIARRLRAFNDSPDQFFYTVVDLNREVFYSTETAEFCNPLPEDRLDLYRSLSGSGVEGPYVSEANGERNLGSYECFTFADGVPGLVRRAKPLSLVVDEFSLSFYEGEGVSYIVDREGNILVRSERGNESIAFDNIFEMMEEEDAGGGEGQTAADFRASLAEGNGGILRFNAVNGEKYVYTYVPVEGTAGWHFVTVVPNDVIMAEGGHILNVAQFFLFIIGTCCVILIAIVLLIWKNHKIRKKVDQEVRYREQIFNILTNSSGDVFVMFTALDGQVEYVSPNADLVLGIPAESAAQDISLLYEAKTDREAFKKQLYQLAPGDSFSFEEERIHRETGEHRWFMTTAYRVNVEAVDKFVLVFSDRTAEKQKERTLEEAVNIAQAANQSKSVFLSNMSHDIRTPMNAIVGFCTLLQRDASDPDRVRDYTKKITASSQHLLGLINDVLDMSKIESGKTTLNISELNLAEVVEGLDTIIRPQTKAKKQSFEISVYDVKSEHLLGDALRINQILINILSNAVKYTQPGGRIEMVVRELPQATKNFARLRFKIQDNGIGMSSSFQETIFQPFTREVNSSTNKIQGTGLGMTITKSLVDLMGGVISVESTPGKGSTFTVELELRIQEQDVDQNFWKTCGVTHALVVDDEVEICTSVIGAMAGTGVSMQFALNGRSAIRTVERAHESGRDFDLVLLDWKMPEMSGIETARQIRKTLPENTPILVLTAYDWADIEEEALEAGIDGFLPKPFFFSNFKLTIERLQERAKTAAPREDSGVMQGLHILAAEDNELNSEILHELMTMKGAECEIMENGKEALERFCQSQPDEFDLILMDVQMPVMNGYEATRLIRACGHPRAETIPIIAMTADAFAEDIQKAMEAGMNEHVAKPINLERLEEVVHQVMETVRV